MRTVEYRLVATIGVTEGALSWGYGVGYARALDESTVKDGPAAGTS
jgi:hypothetical protein